MNPKSKHRLGMGIAAVLTLGASLYQTPAAETSKETPRRGGILHLAFDQEFRSLDPAISFDNESVPLTRLLFRGLIDYNDTATALQPDQADEWSISQDGKTYTFRLRPGTRFSNGREVEAEDYVYSLERVLNPKTGSQGQTYYEVIKGAKDFIQGRTPHVTGLRAPDRRTLVIELEEPLFTFRYVIAMAFACVVPREVVSQLGKNFQEHLVGSGPYRLAEWRRGMCWRFERNPYYAGPDGFVDGIEILIGPDRTTIAMMIERGEMDLTIAETPTAAAFKRDPRRRDWLGGFEVACTQSLFLNTELKPFDNVLVRRAVAHAINKERILRQVGGWGKVARTSVPPSMPWSNPGCPAYDYDPQKARALLAEAGIAPGTRTEMWAFPGYYGKVAQAIQQDLREAGLEVEMKVVNFAVFQDAVTHRGKVPCFFWGWTQDYPDPSNFLDVLFNGERITETDSVNRSFYNSESVNRLLNQAGKSLDAAERTELFRKAEDLITQDVPWVPVVYPIFPILHHPRLQNAIPHPVWLWRYERMWLRP
jgi:ABC-type transport system substrate-binding protein